MRKTNKTLIAFALVLAFSLSLLSAAPCAGKAQPLPGGVEAQIEGAGDNDCLKAWGLGLALAAAGLSACGVLCLSLAWYDLALIGVACG